MNFDKGTIKQTIIREGKSIIISFGITIISLFIFSIILTFTNVPENIMNPVIIIISMISVLVGSSFYTIKLKKNGIINGMSVGLLYIILLYILSSIIYGSFNLNIGSILMIGLSLLSGMIGGIIGVNI